MRSVRRFQSQLLFRNGYKANRVIRIRPTAKLNFRFRPVRFGLKPACEPESRQLALDINAPEPGRLRARNSAT